MLHNSHELNGIVARVPDVGKDEIRELPVGANLAFLLGHAHMGLVDEQLVLARKACIRPGESLRFVHHLGAPGDGVGILGNPAGVEGNVLGAGHVGVHNGFHLAAVP